MIGRFTRGSGRSAAGCVTRWPASWRPEHEGGKDGDDQSVSLVWLQRGKVPTRGGLFLRGVPLRQHGNRSRHVPVLTQDVYVREVWGEVEAVGGKMQDAGVARQNKDARVTS